MQRPIVTFTTDFGTRDAYAAAMKAAVLRVCPEARLIDVTHEIPRHDVLAGSVTLERAVSQFHGLERVVHLCVVDPGVGTGRAILAALTGDAISPAWIVCPDNGLLTWVHHRAALKGVWRIPYDPAEHSAVFHGRDIMAPLAGRLARDGQDATLRESGEPVLLPVAPVDLSKQGGQVIHIDAFGNCTTNLLRPRAMADAESLTILAGGHRVGPVRRTYADVAPGQPLALIGSSDLLEIAVHGGSAAEVLGLKVGDPVRADRPEGA